MELFNSYPFLASVKNYYRSMAGLDIFEFIKSLFDLYPEEIKKRTLTFYGALFQNEEKIKDYKFDNINVYFYLFLRVFNYLLDDIMLANKVANLMSKISYQKMLHASNYELFRICSDIDIKVDYTPKDNIYGRKVSKDLKEEDLIKRSELIYEIPEKYMIDMKTRFKVHFTSYLNLIKNLRTEPEYRLVNQTLDRGYVFVNRKRLARLLSETIKERFILERKRDSKDIKATNDIIMQIDAYRDLYKDIKEKWENYRPEYKEGFAEIEQSKVMANLPPCMNEIWGRLKEGMNLAHHERLVLEFYLNSLGFSEDSVLKIFSTTPDFKEDLARYQIQHAQRKEYISYNCSSIRPLGLCYAEKYNDPICLKVKIKNPLSYARIKTSDRSKTIKIKAIISKRTEKGGLYMMLEELEPMWYPSSAVVNSHEIKNVPVEMEIEIYEWILKKNKEESKNE